MKSSDLFIKCLENEGIEYIFGVPGEENADFLISLKKSKKIKFILTRHEQSAAFMAESYGKLTGKPGIAFVTRGPGACHASVGVHISKQDSTPIILFVGQVESSFYGKEAFQEINYESMFSKVAKWCHQILNVEEIEHIIHKAFKVANTGRKGPVVISLPEDILSKKTTQKNLHIYQIKKPKIPINKIFEIKSLLERSKKPIIILGGGNWNKDSRLYIESFALNNHLPVVTSFRRQDLINNRCKNFVGTLGTSVSPKLSLEAFL